MKNLIFPPWAIRGLLFPAIVGILGFALISPASASQVIWSDSCESSMVDDQINSLLKIVTFSPLCGPAEPQYHQGNQLITLAR